MAWCVRVAAEEDVDRLALVGAATFLETFAGVIDGAAIVAHCREEHSAGAYLRSMQTGATAWLAEAAVGLAPIGLALVDAPSLPGAELDGTDLELKRIYSFSRFHGTGLGSELMRVAVEHARRAEARRLLLGVYEHNARAIAFYRKEGFEPVGRRAFQVGHRVYDDLVLARRVSD